ncbi:hypothetical protein M0L20_07880 [Spirosoma sp. RP8]|uniref:RelA/SpoT domain-containing protein n=1 Tax=Spirosoma liriopis TaxID=2937440 RepID=A0ABT0HJC6_9BACT|nr:hypothetical protein [Spirosoma liriopis]MCK8491768.1 hypothetical protein [Spirosoma liriopis]
MKVVLTVDQIYSEQKTLLDKLKLRVDQVMSGLKKASWHYFSRIKEKESYALKLETGRVQTPRDCEDFFACTLVVENFSQINFAIDSIQEKFEVVYQRPQSQNFTHKDPSSFQFDDLRLYVRLKKAEDLPPTPIDGILFEVQIKTFLQHAWGIATHDLIYKSDTINWPKERIAFQIKAMLEQAEIMISGIEKVIDVPEIFKENSATKDQNKIIEMFKELFPLEELPNDLNRLSKITYELIKNIPINQNELRAVIKTESDLGRGIHLKNLSPYLILIQCLINQKPGKFQEFIIKPNQRYKVLLTAELDISKIDLSTATNIIRLGF